MTQIISWEEGLIEQLPITHDGRNSWLLNHGGGEQAIWLRENREQLMKLVGKEHTDFLTFGLTQVYATQQKVKLEVTRLTYDEEMDRYYIPLPGGWEVQTKGKGSSFRLCKVNPDGSYERWHVLDETLHEPLMEMALAIQG